MVASPAETSRLDAYQLRLPIYEGPLDVLLRLIEREQLEVSEVSLLAVFDQFMTFFRSLHAPAPEVIAEFASVAGRLSVLKSRALLPRPPAATDELEESDLVRQLEEYRALKMAAELLADRQREGAGGFMRGEAVALPPSEPPRYAPQPRTALTRAVQRWASRLPSPPVQVAVRRVVTLREMISHIYIALEGNRKVTFDVVRESCRSRQEVSVAFLAVLTLLRRQAIEATQADLFGTITLSRTRAPHPIHSPIAIARFKGSHVEDAHES